MSEDVELNVDKELDVLDEKDLEIVDELELDIESQMQPGGRVELLWLYDIPTGS